MKDAATKKAPVERSLTSKQLHQLRGLAGRTIDTADIPEAPAANWATAERGRFFKPRKQAISLRLDADLLDWLRRRGPGYQTMVNQLLRERMDAETAKPGQTSRSLRPGKSSRR
jgi:uncharacterized protein (DUF4415 family)